MPKTIIFVGSSQEAKSQAKILIRDLASATVEFLPWWDCFTPGHLLLDDLEAVKKKKASAALLLFTPDIPATVRGNGVALPNQNVLFELGFFFSAFDRRKIALVKYGATYIPKDLEGYTHIPGSGYFKANGATVIGKKTKEAFNKWIANI
ncbi:MAG: TIR domain-containing protein [Chthoniobacterales bacterium]